MATDAEVRAWARETGLNPPVRGKLNPRFHEDYAAAHLDQGEPLGDDAPGLPDGAPVDDAAPFDTGEIAPQPPAGQRAGLLGRKGKAARGPRVAHKRISLAGFLGGGWAALAGIAGNAGLTPTGRILAMQAPVAGQILEGQLSGTPLDMMLQPLARTAEKGGAVGALLGPPVLVTLMQMRPELAPKLVGPLRGALRQWVYVAGPALKAAEKREEKALRDMGEESSDGLDALIEGWIISIFAEPAAPPAPAPPAAGPSAA